MLQGCWQGEDAIKIRQVFEKAKVFFSVSVKAVRHSLPVKFALQGDGERASLAKPLLFEMRKSASATFLEKPGS
jgi:hypothetical protein